jgi:phosphoglycolate phosphatase-like HAD superfamily hydrolase
VIFDFDGTIVKSAYQYREAKQALIRKFGDFGIETDNMDINESTMSIIDKAQAQIAERDSRRLNRLRSATNHVLDDFDVKAMPLAELRLNSKLVLESLANAGVKVGLVTNAGEKAVSKLLKEFEIRRFFDVVVTRDDVRRMKPSSEGLRKAIVDLECDRRDVLYVGDSWIDVRCAKEAGVVAVAITGGLGATDRLEEEAPDFTVNSLDELLNIVGEPRAALP